jgi:hypothetical protein
MADIKGALTRPLGPLPAWGWGVVIGGGFLLYRFLRTGSAFGGSSSSGSASDGTLESSIPGSTYGSGGGGSSSGSTTGSGGTTGTSGTTTATTTTGGISQSVANAIAGGVPGFGDVSKGTQQYWADKLAGTGGIGAGGNQQYNPAMTLAQWLNIQENNSFLPNASGQGLSILPGTPRYAIDPRDLEAGLANSFANAQAAGVTQDELNAAIAELNNQLASGTYSTPNAVNYLSESWATPYEKQLYTDTIALTGGNKSFSEAQTSYINKMGGYNTNPTAAVDNSKQVAASTLDIPAQTPLTQAQFIAANREGFIARSTAVSGKAPSEATINASLAKTYAKSNP